MNPKAPMKSQNVSVTPSGGLGGDPTTAGDTRPVRRRASALREAGWTALIDARYGKDRSGLARRGYAGREGTIHAGTLSGRGKPETTAQAWRMRSHPTQGNKKNGLKSSRVLARTVPGDGQCCSPRKPVGKKGTAGGSTEGELTHAVPASNRLRAPRDDRSRPSTTSPSGMGHGRGRCFPTGGMRAPERIEAAPEYPPMGRAHEKSDSGKCVPHGGDRNGESEALPPSYGETAFACAGQCPRRVIEKRAAQRDTRPLLKFLGAPPSPEDGSRPGRLGAGRSRVRGMDDGGAYQPSSERSGQMDHPAGENSSRYGTRKPVLGIRNGRATSGKLRSPRGGGSYWERTPDTRKQLQESRPHAAEDRRVRRARPAPNEPPCKALVDRRIL